MSTKAVGSPSKRIICTGGAAQIKACQKIIRDNTRDIFFVALRLLNNKCLIVDDESANFVQGPMVRQGNKMRLLRLAQGPEPRP